MRRDPIDAVKGSHAWTRRSPLRRPGTLEALFDATRRAAPTACPKRLRQCADFIARNPDRVAVSTVAELAGLADVQPSAMMRFCQELGFSGFSQMQRLFRDEYSRKWPDYATRLRNLRAAGERRPGALLAEFVEAGRASLENLMATVDAEMLERAVDVLAAAPIDPPRRLPPLLPGRELPRLRAREDGGPLRAPLRRRPARHRPRAAPGDAVLAITFAPYSAETVAFVEAARADGHPVVAITDSLSSPLQRLQVLPLLVSEVDVGAFRALSATFALAITLAVALGARREESGAILWFPKRNEYSIFSAQRGAAIATAAGGRKRGMPKLDVITIGRSSVDLYGAQIGGRLEDMASFQKYIGGSPTNIAAGTARLGLSSGLITRVGDEHMGRFIRETLAAEGVDTRGVVTDPERLTALVILGIRDQTQFPLIFYRENCADMALSEADIDPALIADTRAVWSPAPTSRTPAPRPPSSRPSASPARTAPAPRLDIDYRPNLWGLAGHAAG